MVKFADFCAGSSGRYDRVALVYDIRAGEPFDQLLDTLDRLRASGVTCRMLFLEASVQTIINRYKETRRRHPLMGKGVSMEQAVQPRAGAAASGARPRGFRARYDVVLDGEASQRASSTCSAASATASGMNVNVLSFGFKHGLPIEADLVFDVRFMPNPYYVAELKHQTGLDADVRDLRLFLPADAGIFIAQLEKLLAFLAAALSARRARPCWSSPWAAPADATAPWPWRTRLADYIDRARASP